MRSLLLFLLSLPFALEARQQDFDTLKTYTLDAVPIVLEQLTTERFIKEIVEDSSFFQAFRDMKRYDFVAENWLSTYDKKNRIEGKSYRKLLHDAGASEKIRYLARSDSGKLFKKDGIYDLYTLELFDYIFMNAYRSAYSTGSGPAVAKGDQASYREKLKTLLFSPGRPVKGIPFIGDKTEIFSPEMRKFYDYQYFQGTYLDSIPVYRFRVSAKTGLSRSADRGLMIRELTTIIDRRNRRILGRYVDMKYDNLLFDFNVKMNIELGYFDSGKVLLPTKISYRGNWDVPFKKEERAGFLVLQGEYK